MNDVPLHSGSRWETPSGTLPPSDVFPSGPAPTPTALADPVPGTAAATADLDERDERRRGLRTVLVALLALLVLALSGAWAAWGDELRAFVHPQPAAAPASDHSDGGAGEPGHRSHVDRFDADGDGGRGGGHRRLGDDAGGDDSETSDDGSSTQRGAG